MTMGVRPKDWFEQLCQDQDAKIRYFFKKADGRAARRRRRRREEFESLSRAEDRVEIRGSAHSTTRPSERADPAAGISLMPLTD